MSLSALATSPFVATLCLALLHFLWQGALIAAFLFATLAGLERNNAPARHAAACVALVLMALAPALTFAFFWTTVPAEPLVFPRFGVALPAPPEASAPVWPAFVVLSWMTGALFMSARLFVGLARLSTLIRRHTTAVPLALQKRLDKLARRLGIARRVRLLGSARVDVPMVVGFLRPVVLVPLSALTDLSPSCLAALLAHELAHVRRLDFLTNVLQSIVEAALFYHPAVHWVSNVIRKERENLCDDAAAEAVGDPVRYARALASLEVMRARLPELALGSNGGSLVMRIRRLIEGNAPNTPAGRALAAPALVVTTALGLVLSTFAACGGETAPAVEAQSTPAPTQAEAALGIPWLPPALTRWQPVIDEAAHKNGVDPDIVAIVTLVESGGDPAAKSSGGALGLMQIMPATATAIAEERGIADHSAARLLDPAYNLELGAFYFGKQLATFGAKDRDRAVELSAAAYNGGPKIVHDWLGGRAKLSAETERYRQLVAGMWGERKAARSATYDGWRERIRAKMASRSEHPVPVARVTLRHGEPTPAGDAHAGVDLAAALGVEIHAPLDGTIERVEKNAKGEQILVVSHGGGIETVFRHIANISAPVGAAVRRGDVIGAIGASSGGPHVHFEVRDNGEPIDPARYLEHNGAAP